MEKSKIRRKEIIDQDVWERTWVCVSKWVSTMYRHVCVGEWVCLHGCMHKKDVGLWMNACMCCVRECECGKRNKENWSFQQPAFPKRFETTLKAAGFRGRKFVQTETSVGGKLTIPSYRSDYSSLSETFWVLVKFSSIFNSKRGSDPHKKSFMMTWFLKHNMYYGNSSIHCCRHYA